jgi:hypothetical protein
VELLKTIHQRKGLPSKEEEAGDVGRHKQLMFTIK